MPCKPFCISVGDCVSTGGRNAGANCWLRSPRLTFAPLKPARSGECVPVEQWRAGAAVLAERGGLRAARDAGYGEHKQLRATETITYTNNSPDALPSLWVQLEQNIYREDSRAHIIGGSARPRRRRNATAADANAGAAEDDDRWVCLRFGGN